MVNQDAAHRDSTQSREVRPILKLCASPLSHAHEGFVDERRRLQGVRAWMLPKMAPRQRPQLLIDGFHELRGLGLVATGENSE
ncbi:MAG: hypothetical protein ACI8X5_004243 [Planctomycetota bacterium]|jgi:hypothetical protein